MTKQYQVLMRYDGVTLDFEPEALEAVADKAIERKIGARGLRSVMESVMGEVMYTVPSDPTVNRVIVTAESVKEGKLPLIEHINKQLPAKKTKRLAEPAARQLPGEEPKQFIE